MKKQHHIPHVRAVSWQRLYDQALAYLNVAPWKWMNDCDVFGVQNPTTHEIGYCSVLGAADVCYGMAVYRGANGYRVLEGVQAESIDRADIPYVQDAIFMEFVRRGELDQKDKAVLKELSAGVTKRRGVWPQFRSYSPGLAPWYLTEEETIFMARVLERACVLTPIFGKQPELLKPLSPRMVLTSVLANSADTNSWEERWIEAPDVQSAPAQPIPLDELRLKRAVNRCNKRMDLWEVAIPFFPGSIWDAERPYYPKAVMIADGSSGFIFGTEIVELDRDLHAAVCENLLKIAEQHQTLPQRIAVKDKALWISLKELCAKLGLQLIHQKHLPQIESAYEDMKKSMSRR